MLKMLRREIRKYPLLYGQLLPWWIRIRHLQWLIRNLISRGAPVVLSAGSFTVRLNVAGEIPEALWTGNYEAMQRDFISTYLREGMTVIDVGANVGLYTVMASVLVGPSGNVHAFEPSGITFSRFADNLRLNGCTNVSANQLALSDSAKEMILRVDPGHPENDGHCFVVDRGSIDVFVDSDEVVPCQTLDRYWANYVYGVDFIKIDVEGAELSVLRGAIATLSPTNITMILECTRNQKEVVELLSMHGFLFFLWDIRKKALTRIPADQIAGSNNVIVRRQPWCL
jgi:FkbM family methyltransferase